MVEMGPRLAIGGQGLENKEIEKGASSVDRRKHIWRKYSVCPSSTKPKRKGKGKKISK